MSHFIAIAGFFLVYGLIASSRVLPSWLPLLYGSASFLGFSLFTVDKSAAKSRSRRVPERTLLLVCLLGGWPGVALGQQLLGHKTRKHSFRFAFWSCALLNAIAFSSLSYLLLSAR